MLIEDREEVKDEQRAPAKRFENSDDSGDVIRSFNVPTESIDSGKREEFSMPSLYANHLSNSLNYPAMIFIVDTEHQASVNRTLQLTTKQFPCDTHLLTLRTTSDLVYPQFPAPSALLVLHRQGYDCAVNKDYSCDKSGFSQDFSLEFVTVKEIEVKTLTGIDSLNKLRGFGEVYIEPMSLKTFNVTFG